MEKFFKSLKNFMKKIKWFSLIYKIGLVLLFFATMFVFLFLIIIGITKANISAGIGGGVVAWLIRELLPHLERLYKEEKRRWKKKRR